MIINDNTSTQSKKPLSNRRKSTISNEVLMQYLYNRRISPETIAIFGIEPWENGWRYPVPGGGYHWKNVNSNATYKYRWLDKKPDTAIYYHAPNLALYIGQSGGACWYVSGQSDVWAMFSAGIPYVLSAYSESYVPDNLVDYLKELGVTILYIAPDIDGTGDRWAMLVRDALQGSGIKLEAYELPPDLCEHGDLGGAWEIYDELYPFERWLLSLPHFTYPKKLPKLQKKNHVSSISAGAIPAEYRSRIADVLGVTGWKSDGNSIKNVACPFHDDKHPSATLHRDIGLYCHTCGQYYSWNDIGIKVGIGSVKQWQLANQSHRGIPTELREGLIKAGLTSLSRLLDALALAGFQSGQEFTNKEAVTACTGILSPKTIRNALDIFCPFFPPYYSSLDKDKKEKVGKKSSRGRPAKIYKLPSVTELIDLLADKYNIKVHPLHHDDIPVEKIGNAADYRAEVYAALPRRKPGKYTRLVLAKRIGVSKRTTQTYDKRAGLIVTPNIAKRKMGVEEINNLPAELSKDRKYHIWLEDQIGKKYPPVRRAAEWIAKHGIVYEVRQFANTYQAG